MLTRGDKNNRVYVGDTVKMEESVSSEMQSALFDPQTAGGLLISMDKENARKFLLEMSDAVIIGGVATKREHLIEVS
jgi:selenide,water dikinase